MTSSEIILLVVSTINMLVGGILYVYILSIKCNVPICISWLARGLASSVMGGVFIYLLVIFDIRFSMIVFNYLYGLLLTMYALWQTKFTTNISKMSQKRYILILNSLVCLICLKYLVTFSKDCLGVLPQFLDDNPTLFNIFSIINGFAFLIAYVIYTITNVQGTLDPKFKRFIYILKVTLGMLIFYNAVQVFFDTMFVSTFENGFLNEQYIRFFCINTIIKLLLNLVYMGMIWVQVICYKGRYLDD